MIKIADTIMNENGHAYPLEVLRECSSQIVGKMVFRGAVLPEAEQPLENVIGIVIAAEVRGVSLFVDVEWTNSAGSGAGFLTMNGVGELRENGSVYDYHIESLSLSENSAFLCCERLELP